MNESGVGGRGKEKKIHSVLELTQRRERIMEAIAALPHDGQVALLHELAAKLDIDLEAEPVKNRETLQNRRELVAKLKRLLGDTRQIDKVGQDAAWDIRFLKNERAVGTNQKLLQHVAEAYSWGKQIAKAVLQFDATEFEPAMYIHLQSDGRWRSIVPEPADENMKTAVSIVNTVLQYCEEYTPEILTALNIFVAKQEFVSLDQLTDEKIRSVHSRRLYLGEIVNSLQRLDKNLPYDIEMKDDERKEVQDFFARKYHSTDTDFKHIYSAQ